jgi:hypothetical protein
VRITPIVLNSTELPLLPSRIMRLLEVLAYL